MSLKNLSISFTIFVVYLMMMMSDSGSLAREFPSLDFPVPSFNLTIGGGGNALDCWNALSEIRTCSNEIVAYFTNGTIDISPPCCQAITLITHNCWPAMLSAVGFTPDQTNILRGYCDATASNSDGGFMSFGPGPSPIGQPGYNY